MRERLFSNLVGESSCTLRKASVLKVEHDFPVSCILRLKASWETRLAFYTNGYKVSNLPTKALPLEAPMKCESEFPDSKSSGEA